jgi:hypothetical protein
VNSNIKIIGRIDLTTSLLDPPLSMSCPRELNISHVISRSIAKPAIDHEHAWPTDLFRDSFKAIAVWPSST